MSIPIFLHFLAGKDLIRLPSLRESYCTRLMWPACRARDLGRRNTFDSRMRHRKRSWIAGWSGCGILSAHSEKAKKLEKRRAPKRARFLFALFSFAGSLSAELGF